MLRPNGTTSYEARKGYKIYIPHELLVKIQYLVAKATKEVQWYHEVYRHDTDQHIGIELRDMFVPPQFVSGAEAETTPEQEMEYYQYLETLLGDRVDDSRRIQRAWCHSHVNMGTSPSGQDLSQFNEHIDLVGSSRDKTTPVLMMIFNKKDEVFCKLWDPVTGYVVVNPPIIITESVDLSGIDEIFDKHVRERTTRANKKSDWSPRDRAVTSKTDGILEGDRDQLAKWFSIIENEDDVRLQMGALANILNKLKTYTGSESAIVALNDALNGNGINTIYGATPSEMQQARQKTFTLIYKDRDLTVEKFIDVFDSLVCCYAAQAAS